MPDLAPIELTEVEARAEAPRYVDAWQDPGIPRRQWEEAVAPELARLRDGKPCAPFAAFIRLMQHVRNDAGAHAGRSPVVGVLDVGASSGYYGEVLEYVPGPWHYRACDYSEAFKDWAMLKYPALLFDLVDGTRIREYYGTASWDLVVSGCMMLIAPDWRACIDQAAAVSRRWVLFHRTPLAVRGPRYFRRLSYGVPHIETHFDEVEFRSAIEAAGLRTVQEVEVCAIPHGGRMVSTLCEKETS